MNFHKLYSYGKDAAYISKMLNSGEFDYYLYIRVYDWKETTGEDSPKYVVALSAVSPQLNPDETARQFADNGIKEEYQDDHTAVKLLESYGRATPLWNEGGNNITALLKMARDEADKIARLFDFYMNRPCNLAGWSGWRFLGGHDVWDKVELYGRKAKHGSLLPEYKE